MLAGAGEIEAGDDLEASRLAAALERPETVEVWREGRRILTIFPTKESGRRSALTE
jgi:hypothetical protein